MNDRVDTNTLKYNIEKIKEGIQEHKKVQDDVDIVVVTKYVGSDVIRNLYDLGWRKFGENRTEDLLKKQEELADINDDIEWHFIGRLQTRPVRKMINQITVLHSLDRLSLAKEVNKRADKPISCFLQINISGEEQKAGFQPNETLDIVEKLEAYRNIHIDGLMTMAPHDAKPEELRYYFSKMKQLQVNVQNLKLSYAPCMELSMGMSDDFTIAVEEGATLVRIGRAVYKD